MNMKQLTLTIASCLALTLTACSDDNDNTKQTDTKVPHPEDIKGVNIWFDSGKAEIIAAKTTMSNNEKGAAKNVILFVGDGMGISTVTAARILQGQNQGKLGEENLLSFETMPFAGLSKTYNTDYQTPDSAGTMTAMITGVKTRKGLVSIPSSVPRGNCAQSKDKHLTSALVLAEQSGMATGVISTARLTHATPAATYANSADRDWENDAELTEEAKTNGCKDIASQLIDFPYGDGIEVALGGGRRNFLPKTVTDQEGDQGKREDGKDLTAKWLSQYENAAYVWSKVGFDAIKPETTDHLLGLFEDSHMAYEADRANDKGGEPSLAEMTDKAIDILKKDKDGFFLVVEAGRIDHGHHAGNAARALHDTIALSDAVKVALEKTNEKDTLIIATADHSHVMTIGGYATRGNPILGLVKENDKQGNPKTTASLDNNGQPYTTLGYMNGKGYHVKGDDTRQIGRQDLTDIDVTHLDYHQEALIPLKSETHASEDVGIYASGPSASLLTGTNEQNVIFHVMNHAANLKERVTAR
nr:alkaline phosphatase [Algicola sagamiensis]